MAKEKKNTEADVAVETAAPAVRVRLQASPVKTMSFVQWAVLRGIPERHLGGISAFFGEKSANRYSLADWDQLYSTY